jgi:hypothetical protein
LGCGPQHVADVRHGEDVLRIGRSALDLLAQALHKLLEQLPVADPTIAPYMVDEPFNRNRVFGIGEQILQQPKSEVREAQWRSIVDVHALTLGVELQVAAGLGRKPFSPRTLLARVRGLNGLVR